MDERGARGFGPCVRGGGGVFFRAMRVIECDTAGRTGRRVRMQLSSGAALLAGLLIPFGAVSLLAASEAERGRFVDEHKALLLRDSAQFFESSNRFRDGLDAAAFLAQIIPVGTTYSDSKKKLSGLMERLAMGQRMHVQIFLNEKSIVIGFGRTFLLGDDLVDFSLTYVLDFEQGKRTKDSLVPTSSFGAHRGPPPRPEDIEPEKKPPEPAR